MKQKFIYVLFFLVAFTQIATAQPADVSRWISGTLRNTANPQTQGFAQGDPLILTWGFMAEGTRTSVFDRLTSNVDEFLTEIYSGGRAEYQPLVSRSIERWGEICGLTITHEPNDDGVTSQSFTDGFGVVGVRADVRIGGSFIDGDRGNLANAQTGSLGGGDIIIDTGDNFYDDTSDNSIRLRNIIGHEFGHSIGLLHTEHNDTSQLLEPFLQLAIDGPQYHDILMAQRGFGDIYETGAGNDTSSNATDLGIVGDGMSVVIGDSAHRTGTSALFDAKPTGIEITFDEIDFVSIDDQSDTDVYSFTVPTSGSADVVLDVLGETYSAGAQNRNNEIDFDTSRRSNLTLEILDTNGSTVLATANAGGLGSDESLLDISLDAGGTYFVRVTGVDNADALVIDTQFYGLSIDFTANGTPASQFIDLNGDFRDGLNGWTIESGRADLSGRGHDDDVSARLREDDTLLTQQVDVRPNTNYQFRGRIETEGRIGFFMGGQRFRKTRTNTGARNFRTRSFRFNTGNNDSITIFAEYRSQTGRFDDFTLENLDGTEN